MVTSGAMMLRSRTMMHIRVSTEVTRMASRGLPSGEVFAIRSLKGMMLFCPMAIRMRGPPTRPASADDAVAPSNPAMTMGGQSDLSMATL